VVCVVVCVLGVELIPRRVVRIGGSRGDVGQGIGVGEGFGGSVDDCGVVLVDESRDWFRRNSCRACGREGGCVCIGGGNEF